MQPSQKYHASQQMDDTTSKTNTVLLKYVAVLPSEGMISPYENILNHPVNIDDLMRYQANFRKYTVAL